MNRTLRDVEAESQLIKHRIKAFSHLGADRELLTDIEKRLDTLLSRIEADIRAEQKAGKK